MDNHDRTKRRHLRDESVIDHLADKVFEPSGIPNTQRQTTATDAGLLVEKQVQKKWDPKKGGLGTFTRFSNPLATTLVQSTDSSTPSRIQPLR